MEYVNYMHVYMSLYIIYRTEDLYWKSNETTTQILSRIQYFLCQFMLPLMLLAFIIVSHFS